MQTSLPTGPRWYVISLRPLGAHAPLRAAAKARGHGFLPLSPWRIAVRDDAPTRDALARALAAGRVVFTSPAAVASARSLMHLPDGLHALAVGAGTAAALRRAGVGRVEHPRRMDSEGLLSLHALADVAGADIGLVTAPGGRDAIGPALQARGARVHRADVYARVPLPPAPRDLARVRGAGGRLAIAASSAEALERVMQAVDDAMRGRLLGARVLAASARVATTAAALGFSDVVTATGPRPRQLVAALDDAPR